LAVYLRKISESQQIIAKSLETIAQIEKDKWEQQHAPRPKGKFTLGQMDVAAVNERYKKMQESKWEIKERE
jgi:hypothetical protein